MPPRMASDLLELKLFSDISLPTQRPAAPYELQQNRPGGRADDPCLDELTQRAKRRGARLERGNSSTPNR